MIQFTNQLTSDERAEVVANCDHLQKLKHSPTLPYAFTEYGAIMVANVLKSKQAIETSILIVRALVKLREMLASHAALARKLREMERKYDSQFKVVFDAIRELMAPPKKKQRRIGFQKD